MKPLALTFTFLFLFSSFYLLAQCPTGNVVLNTQTEVNQFLVNNPMCTTITDVLEIDDDGTDPITDLTPLTNLVSVATVRVLNTTLSSFAGLSNIITISGTLLLQNNSGILNTSDFSNVTPTTVLFISGNTNLADCTDFCNFIGVSSISIGANTGTCAHSTIFQTTCAALPIELSSLEAAKQGNVVLISWETLSEVNNQGFSIEKSIDGKNWAAIGWLDGHDTDRSINYYEFIDQAPAPKANYYRLKQIDFDGRFEHSHVVNAYFSTDRTTFIYPNPAKNIITVGGLSGDMEPKLRIFNALGQVVLNAQGTSVAVGDLPKGVYSLEIQLAGEVIIEKLFLQ